MSVHDAERSTEEGSERAELAALTALGAIEGIGPATLLDCLAGCGAAVAWSALRSGCGGDVPPIAEVVRRRRQKEPDVLRRLERAASELDADEFLARHEAAGQRVVRYGAVGYPERLLADPAPPALVFLRGSSDCLTGPTVGIVGTRNATRLGRETAGRLAVELAERGVSVVSGLAAGIDGAAHAALVDRSSAGQPVGVVATGLERAYPRQHRRLQELVAATGLLLTESPIGTVPARWRFPARNRILAGLCDAVVVVESRSAGGSMLTAAEAVARDRPVLAVPGHPTSAGAAGTLDLISDGAVPVRDVEDVLVAIGCGGRSPARVPEPSLPVPALSPVAERLLDALAANPKTLGELVLVGPTRLDEASGALVELEQAGLVVRSGPWFERAGSSGAPASQGRGYGR